MKGQRKKFILLIIAALATVLGTQAILNYRDQRNSQRAIASTRLRIPKEQRMLLTGGTVDGVGWLEDQLIAGDGSLVALYILNSMMGAPIQNLPDPMPVMGFCGNTPRRERKRLVRQAVRAALTRLEAAREQYLANASQSEFHPLLVIDWNDSLQIEGAFLAAFENRNLGMMAVLQDFEATACMHSLVQPSTEGRIKFRRNDGKYDVEEIASSGRRAIAYEYADEASEYYNGKLFWLSYDIEDWDGDGLKGIIRLGSVADPSQYHPARGGQPSTPVPDELIIEPNQSSE